MIVTRNHWKEDMVFLFSNISKLHPNMYHSHKKSEWDRLKELTTNLDSLDDYKCLGLLFQITTLLDDSHSKIFPVFRSLKELQIQLPLRFNIYDEGLFISGSTGQY